MFAPPVFIVVPPIRPELPPIKDPPVPVGILVIPPSPPPVITELFPLA